MTVIVFGSANVDLVIYNLLGEEITRLAANIKRWA